MKLALIVVLALFVGCKEKAAPPKPAEPAALPARPAPPVVAAEPRAPEPPAVIDAPAAADPIDAPPTKSQLALAARGEFLSKVNKTSKRGAGDCRALLVELESFAAEARAMAQRRAEVTGDEIAADDAMVATTLRSLTRMTSACPEKDRFDAFLNILGSVPQ